MPTVTYKLFDGGERTHAVEDGSSVMLGAILNNVPGIMAECGGSCSCATCHVYVDEAFLDRLPAADPVEDELLEGVAAERRPNSRLSCQITVTPALDGLVVHIPERQAE